MPGVPLGHDAGHSVPELTLAGVTERELRTRHRPDRGKSTETSAHRCKTVHMATGNGWYLLGPLIAVGLVVLLGAIFWRLGLQWTLTGEDDGDRYADGLAIFGELEDYGLLSPAAVTDDAEVADEIQRVLGDAGIRATRAVHRDGRTAVLVFAEEVEEARRLVGDSPTR